MVLHLWFLSPILCGVDTRVILKSSNRVFDCHSKGNSQQLEKEVINEMYDDDLCATIFLLDKKIKMHINH